MSIGVAGREAREAVSGMQLLLAIKRNGSVFRVFG